jgi:ParB/RepB/Spo0J family partition protein
LPSDFAKEIAKSLGMTDKWVDEWFTVEEDKLGYFIAKLQPKKFLEKDQFRTLCALTRDLGGEGYLQGMKAWKVPGPLAKKPLPQPDTTSTPGLDARSTPQPVSGVAPDSLIYDKSKPPDIPNIKFIPIDAVKIPNILPTRELISHERLTEITNSIKKHGLKYPIKVRRANSDYELIDGYLRLKCVQQLGWKGILAEIKDASDQEVIVESIVTNKHRIEEDPITIAKKCDVLVNAYSWTQEKIAEETGLSREYVANATRLLKLPKQIQREIASNKIGFRHGLTLLTVNNVDLQLQLATEVVEEGSTISELEERIRELQPKPVAPSPHEIPVPSQPSEPSTEARRTVQSEARASTSPLHPTLPSETTTAAPPKEEPTEALLGYEVPKLEPKLESEPKPLPKGEFDIILADPPWRYEVSHLRGSPENHYQTMSTEAICELTIPSSENAVLFLWATNPMLKDALKVMESWGFQYKTNLVWVKNHMGVGFWFRGQHELLLVGVKGNVSPPEQQDRYSSCLNAPVREHSQKPDEVYEIIEKMFPTAKARLELFARNKRESWEAWGNEV